jgi:3-oxoacyl-[acyl-carrier protein] reductase
MVRFGAVRKPGHACVVAALHQMKVGHLTVEEAIKKFLEQSGISRFGEPEEIADLLAYLVSVPAKRMTGAWLRMDGGEFKEI